MSGDRPTIVVPTEYRAKLPKSLSYPLGAEVVSNALAGVPQFDQLRLWFSDRPVFSAVEFQRMLRAGTPYTVLEVSFEKWAPDRFASHAMVEAGHYERKWRITVYGVPTGRRHAVRTALVERALPMARQWLSQPDAAGWAVGYKRLTFIFDPADASVSVAVSGDVLS